MKKSKVYTGGQKNFWPDMTEIALQVDRDLAQGEMLPFVCHWFIGSVFIMGALLIDNHAAMWANLGQSLMGLCAFGLVAGFISWFLVMRIIPAPYAWLSRKLGLLPEAGDAEVSDVTFELNPTHQQPALVIAWPSSEKPGKSAR